MTLVFPGDEYSSDVYYQYGFELNGRRFNFLTSYGYMKLATKDENLKENVKNNFDELTNFGNKYGVTPSAYTDSTVNPLPSEYKNTKSSTDPANYAMNLPSGAPYGGYRQPPRTSRPIGRQIPKYGGEPKKKKRTFDFL